MTRVATCVTSSETSRKTSERAEARTAGRGHGKLPGMRTALLLALSMCMAACGDDTSPGGGGQGGGGAPAGGGGQGGGVGGLVCDDPWVSKGPWSLAFDETSAKVRWEACADGSDPDLVMAPEGGGDEVVVSATVTPFELTETYTAPLSSIAPPDYAGTYYMHEAELTGLEAGRCYAYHLAADPSRGGRVCTAKAAGEPFTFAAIGDTNPALGSTDDTISHLLPESPDFTIHGGDIQYYDSLLETWALWFPIMQPLLSQGAFMPAIGNHESELSNELSEYALRFFGGAGFDGGETYYQFQSGGVWFFNLNTEEPISQGSPQAIWLEGALEDAALDPDHRFSVVYFHRPLYSCGDSGDDQAAREFLQPIFEATNVLFVISAHMHGYERFEFDSGPTFLVSGGGGGLLQNIDENLDRPYCDRRVASGKLHHSVLFDVGATEVSGRVIDRDGEVQDTFSRAIP
jgi:hypothetical protein